MGGIGYLDVSVAWFSWWMIRFHFPNSSWCCFKTWNSCHLVWHSWQQQGPFSRGVSLPGAEWLQCNLRPSWRRWRPCRWLDHLQISNLRWSHLHCFHATRKLGKLTLSSGFAGFCPSTVISDLNKPGLIGELQTEKYRSITGNNLGHAKVFYPDMLECWTQNHGNQVKNCDAPTMMRFLVHIILTSAYLFLSYNCPVILGHEHRIRPISSLIILQIYVHICISDSWFLLAHKTSLKTRRLRRLKKKKLLIDSFRGKRKNHHHGQTT